MKINNNKKSLFFLTLLSAFFIYNVSYAADKLLYSSDITYIGSFKVPSGSFGGTQLDGLAYAGENLAYNPAHNSLFMTGHIYEQRVAEISIPTPIIGSINSMNTATVLQNLSDITEGNLYKVMVGGGTYTGDEVRVGGLMVYVNKLIGTSYTYYDAQGRAYLSHWSSGLTLSTTGDFFGQYPVSGVPGPSFVSGYMTEIPTAYQSALGGTHLTGNCCLAIISRTSYGPALFSFNASNVGLVNPIPAAPLLYYPSDHTTLGAYGVSGPNVYFNGTAKVRAVIFPTGTRSVLFVGEIGTGPYCYGTGAACGDPIDESQGTHAYPYRYQIWAYDANDFAAVKAGTKQPWEPVPYSVFSLPVLSPLDSNYTGGATYDPTTKRLYFADWKAAGEGFPLIHVYSVNVDVPSDTTPPAAPQGLSVQ